MHIYIYIYICIYGVNTDGAAAEVMNLDRLEKRYALALLGRYKWVNGSTPKGPSVKKHEIRSDPVSADPICQLIRFAVTPLVD